MIFSFLKRRRRKRLFAEPIPQEWLEYLQRNVWLFGLLPRPDQKRLCGAVQVVTAEKNWEGCAGLEITDEIIAALEAAE